MLITAGKQSLHTHTHKHTPQHTYVLKLRWRVIDGRIFSLLFLAILVENNSAQLFVYCGIMFPRCFGLLCIIDIFHTLTTEDHSRKTWPQILSKVLPSASRKQSYHWFETRLPSFPGWGSERPWSRGFHLTLVITVYVDEIHRLGKISVIKALVRYIKSIRLACTRLSPLYI